ncbi:MAG: hypothetical protein U0800_26035 [Isosphaeraceae bacterium]
MFLRRNQPGQTLLVPGPLVAIATGAPVTSAATITVLKDGAASAGAGDLAHVSGGVWKYTPTAGETDCRILGLVLEAAGAWSVPGAVRTTRADPDDAASLGLSRLDATVGSRLAASSYAAPDNPSDYARNDVAPAWYSAAPGANAIAAAVWDALQSAIGLGATMGQLVRSLAAYTDPWTAHGTILPSPAPTPARFTIDAGALKGRVPIGGFAAVDTDALRGEWRRVLGYDPGTGVVDLESALPSAPPSDLSSGIQFQASPPSRIDLAQPIADVRTATVGGALNGSWAVAWGKVILDAIAKILRVWGAGNDTSNPSANFSVDDADPTSRTPL